MGTGCESSLVEVGNDIDHNILAGQHLFVSDVEWRLASIGEAGGDNLTTVTEVVVFPTHRCIGPDFISATGHYSIDSSMAEAAVEEVA